MKAKSPDHRYYGFNSEEIAVDFLKQKGFSIIEQNFHSRYGEIDIICLDNGYIVFVEVKSSSYKYKDQLAYRVTKSKQKKLYLTALQFTQEYLNTCEGMRFDVVLLNEINRGKWNIEHLENAFQIDEDLL